MFPRRKRKVIPAMRFKNRLRRVIGRVLPRVRAKGDLDRFIALMDFASFDAAAFSYRLPTAVYDEESAAW